ncbi:hypothetical protein [Pseudomonas sp. FP1740]|uniref:hypothetical protein n=1 Tax=Pseudomonas sp. FP1740 TaxID=2954078 RepID=UPI00273755A9|nr:hypothetical protein [Pseudomonas sp. FP1740]WLG47571.1 hypothetical protein PSH69_13560 [Pseudomonas sp. FP1740]
MFRSLSLPLTSCCLLFAASVPCYSSSDERVVVPLPGAKISSPYGVFFDTHKGPGLAFDEDDFGLSAYIGASDVRKDRKSGFKDPDDLDGMGSIKSRPVLGLDGTYQMGPIILGATFEHASRGSDFTWSLPVNDPWSFSTVLAAQCLANDAADSPTVQRRMQTSLVGQVDWCPKKI